MLLSHGNRDGLRFRADHNSGTGQSFTVLTVRLVCALLPFGQGRLVHAKDFPAFNRCHLEVELAFLDVLANTNGNWTTLIGSSGPTTNISQAIVIDLGAAQAAKFYPSAISFPSPPPNATSPLNS